MANPTGESESDAVRLDFERFGKQQMAEDHLRLFAR